MLSSLNAPVLCKKPVQVRCLTRLGTMCNLTQWSCCTDVAENAWLVLNNLLLSMSTFWGTAELTQVINLCLNASTLPCGKLQATATLTKSLTKQPAGKVLLPTLAEIWPSIEEAACAVRAIDAIPHTTPLTYICPVFREKTTKSSAISISLRER